MKNINFFCNNIVNFHKDPFRCINASLNKNTSSQSFLSIGRTAEKSELNQQKYEFTVTGRAQLAHSLKSIEYYFTKEYMQYFRAQHDSSHQRHV